MPLIQGTPGLLLGRVSGGLKPPDIRPNLLSNSGFEANTTGWVLNNGGVGETLNRITSDAKFGAACGECVLDGAVSFQGARSPAVACLANRFYTLGIWVKKVSGSSSLVRLRSVQTTGSLVLDTKTIFIDGVWRFVYSTVLATADDTIGLQVIQGGGSLSLTFRIDGAKIEQGNSPTAYLN